MQVKKAGLTDRLVDLQAECVFNFYLKTVLFSESFTPSIAILSLTQTKWLTSWNLTTECLAVTGGGSVGECGFRKHCNILCNL